MKVKSYKLESFINGETIVSEFQDEQKALNAHDKLWERGIQTQFVNVYE